MPDQTPPSASQPAAPPDKAAPQVGKRIAPKKAKPPNASPGKVKEYWRRFRNILKDQVEEEAVIDARDASMKKSHLLALIGVQSLVIVGLIIAIMFLSPILKPINLYEAIRPDKKTKSLVALTMPNLTDQAILSWSATTITEVMTFGFGDFDQRILSQRSRFTDEGWESFTKAIRESGMRENFKLRQLVLTAVPSDSPVIVAKGEDENQEYQWVVEMPVIMTFTTNNDVTQRKRSIARLTIVRVPGVQNKSGIGIKYWSML